MSAAERVAAVLDAHAFDWATGYCRCGWAGPAIDLVEERHAAHVAEQVAPLIEQAVADALGPVEALAEPEWRQSMPDDVDFDSLHGTVTAFVAGRTWIVVRLRAAIRAGREGAKS